MKYIKFLTFIILINITIVYANPYNNKETVNDIEVISSTWYIWERINTNYGIKLPNWGSPDKWLNQAKKSGYKTDTTPKKNSIVIWKKDSATYTGLVWQVNSDNIVVKTASQTELRKICAPKKDSRCNANNVCNYDASDKEMVCTEKYAAINDTGIVLNHSLNLKTDNIIGYIYLDDKINNVTETNTSLNDKNNSKENSNTKNNPKENNNSNASSINSSNSSSKTNDSKKVSKLKNLKVENYNLNFQEDKDTYTLKVANEIDKVNILAEGDKNAIISGLGSKNLEIGSNKYEVLVTTKDKEDKIYNIEIIRESMSAENKENEELEKDRNASYSNENNSNEKESKINYKTIILGGAIVIFIGLLLFI